MGWKGGSDSIRPARKTCPEVRPDYTNMMKRLFLVVLLILPLIALSSDGEELDAQNETEDIAVPDSSVEIVIEAAPESIRPVDRNRVARISYDWVAIYKIDGEIVIVQVSEYERLLREWADNQSDSSETTGSDTANTPNTIVR